MVFRRPKGTPWGRIARTAGSGLGGTAGWIVETKEKET